tara:strand:- start:6632 stop:6928 length:297 start_codon:yes stop_codon:yes gene_type:complete
MHIAVVPEELKPLFPNFLKKMKNDIDKLIRAFHNEDIILVKKIAHNLKGTAGSYYLENISKISERIQTEEDIEKINIYCKDLKESSENLKITFKEGLF